LPKREAAALRAPKRRPLALAESGVSDAEALRRRLVRLALDVHDGPMQSLTVVGYSVNDLRRRMEATAELDAESVSLDLDRVLTQLGEAERSLRKLISQLEHANPEIDTLGEILDGEIDAFSRRCSAHLDVDAPSELQLDSHSQAVAIRSVLREALTNVAKHAGARRVQIRVETGAAGILLEIEDDGAGFDPAAVRSDALGLFGMTSRVDLLGGDFDILSRPGGPTVVTARFRRWNSSAA
jgi:two-component system sensor histidine kinase DegS